MPTNRTESDARVVALPTLRAARPPLPDGDADLLALPNFVTVGAAIRAVLRHVSDDRGSAETGAALAALERLAAAGDPTAPAVLAWLARLGAARDAMRDHRPGADRPNEASAVITVPGPDTDTSPGIGGGGAADSACAEADPVPCG